VRTLPGNDSAEDREQQKNSERAGAEDKEAGEEKSAGIWLHSDGASSLLDA
jgi:hypothetical protein